MMSYLAFIVALKSSFVRGSIIWKSKWVILLETNIKLLSIIYG